jgi:adhesin transport system membrane fusion protein
MKERRVEIERLQLQMSERKVEIAADRALIRRRRLDIEKRTVRAPVDGKLGWIGDMSAGLVVRAGDEVAVVVPSGELRIVAYFPAREAMGRIRAGQIATLRVHAYPWTQYGVLTGRIAHVASEASEDRLRVEVELDDEPWVTVPREHGLKGSLEVAVERVTPLTMLLRSVGSFITSRDHDGSEPADEHPS